jgi:hypothetical protein
VGIVVVVVVVVIFGTFLLIDSSLGLEGGEDDGEDVGEPGRCPIYFFRGLPVVVKLGSGYPGFSLCVVSEAVAGVGVC